MTILTMIQEQSLLVISIQAQIVRTMMMMGQIQIPMKTDGSKPFTIRGFSDKVF